MGNLMLNLNNQVLACAIQLIMSITYFAMFYSSQIEAEIITKNVRTIKIRSNCS